MFDQLKQYYEVCQLLRQIGNGDPIMWLGATCQRSIPGKCLHGRSVMANKAQVDFEFSVKLFAKKCKQSFANWALT